MTNKNAIEIIDNILSNEKIKNRLDSDNIDRLREAKLVIRKQIPKKPIINKENINNVNYKVYMCPCCKKQIIKKIDGDIFVGKIPYYCDDCGQAINRGYIK